MLIFHPPKVLKSVLCLYNKLITTIIIQVLKETYDESRITFPQAELYTKILGLIHVYL